MLHGTVFSKRVPLAAGGKSLALSVGILRSQAKKAKRTPGISSL